MGSPDDYGSIDKRQYQSANYEKPYSDESENSKLNSKGKQQDEYKPRRRPGVRYTSETNGCFRSEDLFGEPDSCFLGVS